MFLQDGETEELEITYAELDRRARAIGAQLQALGMAGERARDAECRLRATERCPARNIIRS